MIRTWSKYARDMISDNVKNSMLTDPITTAPELRIAGKKLNPKTMTGNLFF
jgi:hypothetical protein